MVGVRFYIIRQGGKAEVKSGKQNDLHFCHHKEMLNLLKHLNNALSLHCHPVLRHGIST